MSTARHGPGAAAGGRRRERNTAGAPMRQVRTGASTTARGPDPAATGRTAAGALARRFAATKVPDATPSFWITKVLTTAMGEATSDFLVHAINPYVAVLLGALFFAVGFGVQVAAPRYVIWKYWLAVTGVGVFGTMVADVLHVALGVPYVVSAPLFACVLAAVLISWHRSEGTMSIHTIDTARRELFYWATVVATFALGTAAGDMTATSLGLGYLPSAILFVAIIAIPAVGYWRFRWNAVLAFWFAYIVTRPIGASFADWLGFPPGVGGVGFGHGPVALVLTVMIVVSVAAIMVRARVVGTAARGGPVAFAASPGHRATRPPAAHRVAPGPADVPSRAADRSAAATIRSERRSGARPPSPPEPGVGHVYLDRD